MRLGDVLAEKKRWPEAADRYKQAAEGNAKDPLSLYPARLGLVTGW